MFFIRCGIQKKRGIGKNCYKDLMAEDKKKIEEYNKEHPDIVFFAYTQAMNTKRIKEDAAQVSCKRFGKRRLFIEKLATRSVCKTCQKMSSHTCRYSYGKCNTDKLLKREQMYGIMFKFV